MDTNDLSLFISRLRQGDIIFHHAHDSLSSLIQTLDNSNYNHCSIYDKDGYIYESVKEGVVRKKISESIIQQKTYSITNFRVYEMSRVNSEKLIEIINKKYLGKYFAKTQIVFLALVFLRKKLMNVTRSNFKVAIFIVRLFNFIFRFLDFKNNSLICSELIYRVFREFCKEDGGNMNLMLSAKDSVFNEYYYKLETNSNENEMSLQEMTDFRCYTNFFYFDENPELRTKQLNLERNIRCLKILHPKLIQLLKKIEPSNFVSPKDLSKALNVYKLDTFFSKKHTKCEFCCEVSP